MTQPISGYRAQSYDPLEHMAQGFCQNANNVIEGVLCDESAVVSNACRSPGNAVDRFVCDDPKMAGMQHEIWDTLKSLATTIVGVLAGRR